MVDAQITKSGKRIITKVFAEFVNIIYDRGYYWKVENAALTPYKTKQLLKTPAHDYAGILTVIEKGRFITLINFEEFNTYNVIEGLTDEPDGIKKELPKIKNIKKKDYFILKGIQPKKDDTDLEEEMPGLLDAVVDVYNRIYGIWKVRSYLPPGDEIVEVIYNDYQEIAYYIVYNDNGENIVISPITTFAFKHPLGPKIVDIAKDSTITQHGYDGFAFYRALQKFIKFMDDNFEKLKNDFKEPAEIEPISPSARKLTLKNEGQYVLLPFIDGEEPVYTSVFGFYKGEPKGFTPEKAVRTLENLIKPGHYSDGDYEIKIFDDYTYAVRYREYVLLPCCLAKTKVPISIEGARTPEEVLGEVMKVGYHYATTDPKKYIAQMKFDVPEFKI